MFYNVRFQASGKVQRVTMKGLNLPGDFLGGSAVKNACNAGDCLPCRRLPAIQETWVPSLGWNFQGSFPGEGNSNPLQYSCLGNPMDRGVWWTTVLGVSRVGHDLTTKPHHHHHQTYQKTWSNSNSSIVSNFVHFFTVFKIFIWLHWVLVAAQRIFLAAACKLAWSMWDSVPWSGIKPEPHVLEGWSLTHWATREVLAHWF